ncbi:MAG: tetratricopeptide repeat protein [Candidatus Eisenbacteria bacterium]
MNEFPDAGGPAPLNSGQSNGDPHPQDHRGPQPGEYLEADALDVDSHLAQIQKADVLIGAKQYGSAIQRLSGALRDDQTTRERLAILRRIAFCQERMERRDVAIALLAPAVEEASAELSSPDDLAELGEARAVLGKAYLENSRKDEAEQQAQTMLRQLNDRIVSHRFPIAVAHNLLGAVAYRRGNFDVARNHFEIALQRFGAIGDFCRVGLCKQNLGLIHSQHGDWTRALDHLNAAYYLQESEGETETRGSIPLNIAPILMKLGRHGEAYTTIEQSLARAVEMDQPTREARARLTLAQWYRDAGDPLRAREELLLCGQRTTERGLRREGCLVALEEGKLAIAAGDLDSARHAEARARMLLTGGSLDLEVELLTAEIAMREGRWEEAKALLTDAHQACREMRHHAVLVAIEIARVRCLAGMGHYTEAETHFRALASRLERDRELPALAELLELWARIEAAARGDQDAAIGYLEQARDLWRRMLLRRREVSIDLEITELLIDQKRLEEANVLLAQSRGHLGGIVPHPVDLGATLDQVADRLERAREAASANQLDGELVLRKLEELRALELSSIERLRECFQVLRQALDADGGWVGRTQASSIELLSTHSMARLGGNRELPLQALEGIDCARAVLFDGLRGATGVSLEGLPHSAMLLPVELHGRPCLFYLERRGRTRAPFHRSDLIYGSMIAAEISRTLPNTELETNVVGRPELERLRHGIWVADVITQNSRMHEIVAMIARVAPSRLSILLQGETGTGKRVLAQTVHRVSDRRNRPLCDHRLRIAAGSARRERARTSQGIVHRRGSGSGRTSRTRMAAPSSWTKSTRRAGGAAAAPPPLRHRRGASGGCDHRRLDIRIVCATSCPTCRRRWNKGASSRTCTIA